MTVKSHSISRTKSRTLLVMLALTFVSLSGCADQAKEPVTTTQPTTRPAVPTTQPYKVVGKPLVLPPKPAQSAALPASSTPTANPDRSSQSAKSGSANNAGTSASGGQTSAGSSSGAAQQKSSIGGAGKAGLATLGEGSGAENQRAMQTKPSAMQGLTANLPSADSTATSTTLAPNANLIAQLPQADQPDQQQQSAEPAAQQNSKPAPAQNQSQHDAGPGKPTAPTKANLAEEIKSQMLGVTVPTPTLNKPADTTTPIDMSNQAARALVGTWVQTQGPNDPDFSDGGYVSRKLTFTAGGGLLISAVYDSQTQIASVRRFKWAVDKTGAIRVDTVGNASVGSGPNASSDPTNVQVNVAGALVKPATMKLPAELVYSLQDDTLNLVGKQFKKAP